MIKQTFYFENPAYLSMRNRQLVSKLPEVEKNDSFLPEKGRVGIMCVTDKKFDAMELFYCKTQKPASTPCQQIEPF
jgi:CRISPR/Cas system-associated protein endoribonuclease Cas2